MKTKIISCIIVGVLAFACVLAIPVSSVAFAAEIKETSNPKTGSTTVTHTVAPSYTVTIPDTVTIGTSANVTVTGGALIPYNHEINVKLTSDLLLTNNDDDIAYTIKIGENTVVSDATVLTHAAGTPTDTSSTLAFALATGETPIYSGEYKDTITFTVSVDASAPI